jgi:hypothetical protein
MFRHDGVKRERRVGSNRDQRGRGRGRGRLNSKGDRRSGRLLVCVIVAWHKIISPPPVIRSPVSL